MKTKEEVFENIKLLFAPYIQEKEEVEVGTLNWLLSIIGIIDNKGGWSRCMSKLLQYAGILFSILQQIVRALV